MFVDAHVKEIAEGDFILTKGTGKLYICEIFTLRVFISKLQLVPTAWTLVGSRVRLRDDGLIIFPKSIVISDVLVQ